MPRDSDITPAFVRAIAKDSRGRQVLIAGAFQKQLHDVNHIWKLKQCNQWIRYYQPHFMELVTEERENKTWALRNMGYVR